jgi:hypothetical protein
MRSRRAHGRVLPSRGQRVVKALDVGGDQAEGSDLTMAKWASDSMNTPRGRHPGGGPLLLPSAGRRACRPVARAFTKIRRKLRTHVAATGTPWQRTANRAMTLGLLAHGWCNDARIRLHPALWIGRRVDPCLRTPAETDSTFVPCRLERETSRIRRRSELGCVAQCSIRPTAPWTSLWIEAGPRKATRCDTPELRVAGTTRRPLTDESGAQQRG